MNVMILAGPDLGPPLECYLFQMTVILKTNILAVVGLQLEFKWIAMIQWQLFIIQKSTTTDRDRSERSSVVPTSGRPLALTARW